MHSQRGRLVFSLAGHEREVAEAEGRFEHERILDRIWRRDHRVWSKDPAEITNRLGWLESPAVSASRASALNDFTSALRAEGYTHALLLGMGGSSLAAEVFRRSFGVRPGFLDLEVLDSTHPGAVLSCAARLDPQKTLYIAASKSGGTVETFSFMKFFYGQALARVGSKQAGRHFIAITDPGSGLQQAAREYGFRETFLNDPQIGGRYSALSLFGMVPAALLGIDVRLLLERAAAMAGHCRERGDSSPGEDGPGRLGLVLGQMALAGKNKLTLICSGRLAGFADWIEQLIAESTGKSGRGILPVAGERILRPGDYARDRLFVHIRESGDRAQAAVVSRLRGAGHPVVQVILRDVYDLGGEFFRWQMATAIACWRMGVHPFNQPDVEAAKVLARKMLQAPAGHEKQRPAAADLSSAVVRIDDAFPSGEALDALRRHLGRDENEFREKGNDYIAIQAYVRPDDEARQELQALRAWLQRRYRTAVTVGFGPRFLHSTGQLHKGDGGRGAFLQILSRLDQDAPIPDRPGGTRSDLSFAALITAQAYGDRQALIEKKRRVLTMQMCGADRDGFAALARLPRQF
jgi:glucose-6-phosphate isomerase